MESDIATDNILFEELENSGVVSMALSEENPVPKKLSGSKYIVTFDPLDGSSIIGSNWTVGTIFGIWPSDNRNLIGMKCSEMINAGAILYGPRTTLFTFNEKAKCVQEFKLNENGKWAIAKDNLFIKEKAKTFAPGNLRAVNECEKYKKIIDHYITNCYTLRYSGGLVPDLTQIFIKGEGILSNICTPSHPPKLRLLYEVGPLAFLIEKAGGKSSDGKKSIMEYEVTSYDQRCNFCGGSTKEIEFIESVYK